MPTTTLPLELVEIICEKIENDILFEICMGNDLLDNLNDNLIKKNLGKICINGLILQGNLAGVKYMVEKGYNIHENKNYCLKWAKICEKLDIVNFLISLGADSRSEFDIKSDAKYNNTYKHQFYMNVKPIHIDNIKDIKSIHISREFTDPHLRKFMIDENSISDFLMKNPDYSHVYMIRNLDIKYSGGNIPLELAMNSMVLYKWNSDEILKQIIPIKDACYCLFKIYSDFFPFSEIPESEYHKFTIEYDILFLPTKCQNFRQYFFRFNSGTARYNVSEQVFIGEYRIAPDTQIFGRSRDKIYNLLYLDGGVLRWKGDLRYENALVTRNQEETIMNYTEYLLDQYEPIRLCNDTIEELKRDIVMYGELCLPYEIC
jgi:hypothetical protein